MKKLRLISLSSIFLLLVTVVNASSGEKLTKENINTKTEEEINARMEELTKRVEEIQGLDFSTMEKSERKSLKKEVKEIKKEMSLDDRFTISIGAAIIIVLLLIILL